MLINNCCPLFNFHFQVQAQADEYYNSETNYIYHFGKVTKPPWTISPPRKSCKLYDAKSTGSVKYFDFDFSLGSFKELKTTWGYQWEEQEGRKEERKEKNYWI